MPTDSPNTPDYLANKPASEALARKIQAYWTDQYPDVRVWVETFRFRDGTGKARCHYYIRSNLVFPVPQ